MTGDNIKKEYSDNGFVIVRNAIDSDLAKEWWQPDCRLKYE